MTKKSYRIDEVAREFAVSRRTIYRMIEDGQLDSFKVRDRQRIDAAEVERLKKKETQTD
jgi:putative molybdopterin biosynthesis protein